MMRILIPITSIILLLSSSACKVKDYMSDARPISHAQWDSLLRQHVQPDGRVDYEGFIRDSVRFNQYLALLSRHHPNRRHWSREEQMAYWINAYNAFTVKLIVDNYPTASIKDIKSGIPFINTVWDIKFIQIEGATYDLNNIEHGILRPKFKDSRIHFAVNCASISCPKLLNEAYTAERLDAQLDQAARDFLSDTSRNIITSERAQLSRIFSWYSGDFKKPIRNYINRYAPVNLSKDTKIEYLEYNWGLNSL
ncbi:MAG TPA: DUF547 domain-containing protein [Saprospiraceae bacterium]|nr:DUF547 domain-containing protein [Saprospiraceae bacterium]HMP13265.1 DUF547 domain-containing protein [Saprospiraceae bacterium]